MDIKCKEANNSTSNNDNDIYNNNNDETDNKPDLELCRFFFRRTGRCRFGKNCTFSHQVPDGMTKDQALKKIPCHRYLKGNCSYGARCMYFHPSVDDDNDESRAGAEEEVKEAEVCGICLEIPGEYGLLDGCMHSFCYKCLMNWRKNGNNENSDRHSCPLCKGTSRIVIPSQVCPKTRTEKDEIFNTYKKKRGRFPCKIWNGNLGSCKYGRDCLYQHLDRNGSDVKAKDKSSQELFEARCKQRRNRRTFVDFEMSLYEDMHFNMLDEDMFSNLIDDTTLFELLLATRTGYGFEDF